MGCVAHLSWCEATVKLGAACSVLQNRGRKPPKAITLRDIISF